MPIKKYFKLWWLFTIQTAQSAFESRLGVVIFMLGKLLRFGLYGFFLYILVAKTNSLVGYSLWQVLLFYATFNFIDTTSQFFLREVYRFRTNVTSGNFDHTLIKPIPPLLKVLFGGSDVLDLPLFIISFIFIIISFQHVHLTAGGIFLYFLFVLNGLLIALSFHIFVLGLGILTTEIDNTLWIYRDLTQMGRVPVDVYHQPIQSLITFVIPIGVMMTFPVKALMGLLSLPAVVISFFIGGMFLLISFSFWKYSLKHYASASS